MRRVWLFGFLAALAIAAGFLSLTERPLTVTVVRPESDVALRIYGLGTVEARILSRAGFEVGGALTALVVDADWGFQKVGTVIPLIAGQQFR